MKTYKGKESHNLIKLDTANILVYDYFIDYYQNINNDELRTMIENLLLAINSSDSISKVTFNDPRYVYVAIQTLSKHDGYKEVDMVDWILFYQYLKLFYDKRMNGYDDLIRWTNLFIGYSFAKTELTLEESQELSELSKNVIDIIESDEEYQAFVPNYIIGGMMQGVDFEEGDVIDVIDIQDTQEILDLPTPKEKEKVMGEINSEQIQEVLGEETPTTPQEPQLNDEAREKVSSYEVLIRNLKDLISQGGWSDDEKLELEDAVDAYEEAIADILSGLSFEFGGILQSFASPQIMDGMYSVISVFNNGGTTQEELIKTFEFADGSKFIVEFYKGGDGYKNPNLLKIDSGKTNPKEKSLALKTYEQIIKDKLDFQDALVRLVKAKVIKKIEGGDGRFTRYRILQESNKSSRPYMVWNSVYGDLMSEFASEDDAKAYINTLRYEVKDDERDNKVLMSEINELESQLVDIQGKIEDVAELGSQGGQYGEVAQKTMQRLLQEQSDINRALTMKKSIWEKRTGVRFSRGGQSKFNKLSNKVAKNYEGKKVPSEYQKEYGKTYSKEEAKEVGDKVASKVYRLQLAEKNKAKWGGKYDGGGSIKHNYSSARLQGKDNIDWEQELKDYAGEHYNSLTNEEKRAIISDMQKFAKGGKAKEEGYLTYAEGGSVVGYIDLSKEKNVVVNDSGELKDLPIIDIVKKNVIKQYPIAIDGSKKAYDLMMNVYGDNIRTYEGFYVVMLNKANKPIYIYEHTKGGQESTIVDVQLVVSAAQKVLAKGVILVHNHPSGSIRPSEADIKITKDLVQALKVFNVKVLDHIIATENAYYSFADEGDLPMARDGKKLNTNNEEEEYLTYAESQKKYHERAGTTSIKDKQKMAIDFVKENPEVLLLENGAKLDGVPNVEELAKRKLSGNFELPFEMAIYVPSTKNIDQIITKDEFTSRIKEVETFVSKVFGGFSTDRVDGGFYSDDRKKLVREDVAKVYVFGSDYDFESKFTQLINKLKQWGKAWSQESMGFEFEGDLYYVSSAKSKSKDTKMAHGGRVSIEALKEMVGEKPKKLTNREKITMAKAKYSN